MQSKKIISCWALVIFGMVIILLSACKNDVKLPKKEVNGLPDDFVEFYNTFHTDSTFQMAHIEFPLEGYPSGANADSTQDMSKFRWTADKWQMHRLNFYNDKDFSRRFDSPMQIVVNEIIVQKQSGYGTLRRFMKRGTDWHLIFYSDMNRLENK